MAKLPTVSKNRLVVDEAIIKRLAAAGRFARTLRVFFWTGAAAIAGICQYTTWPETGNPTTSQVVGIAATLVVFLFAVASIFGDKDVTDEVSSALKAQASAEASREELEETRRLWPDIERLVALFQVQSLFRDHAETAAATRMTDEAKLTSTMLTLVKRQLPAAAGLDYADMWTICLYRADQIAGDCRFELRAVEHLRAIECDLKDARIWPEGQGVAGLALSTASEILIEDLQSGPARAIFKSSGTERDYDDERYRSIVAVPIYVQGASRPWGVVTGTSSRVGHFNHAHEDGLKNVDAIRAVARYSALLVAIARNVDPASASVAAGTP